jgi:hypothetical protein
MLLIKGNGSAVIEPNDMIITATGKVEWLSKPPILLNIRPPIITPATGPVTAQVAKYIEATFFY